MSIALPRSRPLPQIVLVRDVGYDAIRPAVRAGELVKVRRGAYAPPLEAPEQWRQLEHLALSRCAALARQLSCEFIFSHRTAALIHGCWVYWNDATTHISQWVRPPQEGGSALRRHLIADLPETDIVIVSGVRVTSLERTVVDCARTMRPREALAIADSAMRILARPDRFDRVSSARRVEAVRESLRARLAQRRGDRGVVRARAVVESADAFSESAGETDLRWVAVSRGLPRPVAQLAVETTEGVFFSDLGWSVKAPKTRLVLAEYDGLQKYRAANGTAPGAALYAEKVREDALRAAGAVVHRFVRQHFRDLDALFARLCQGFPPSMLDNLTPVRGLLEVPHRGG
ncbi:hypothetical protein [Georgenia thermotolerans]|uniref:Type IV toxin-antitoxin system AbiEi family antitoxin domain-containing protein n=1 Tax=Georgenia thermotolerans TaxID=527326 RepID=A0A7J5UKI5_9MICO|nr:hypothetical protein [Georgenia thermotolerans]KAE8762846.1 hypothetical protein GB883_17260 [Georgenia thermotolerans]